jgi:4,4'-diaponeurosporenoate glycosyltransferase
MIVLMVLCTLGLLSGFLLMTHVQRCDPGSPVHGGSQQQHSLPKDSVVIIVPARNEENNLPTLLTSTSVLPEIAEIVVVDDNSTDQTSAIARRHNARVLQPGTLPSGFTGKTWACAVGAEKTSSPVLIFLDADTFFEPGGCSGILRAFADQSQPTVLSVLPFAITRRPYEELSLFFNLLMAFGAGGFGLFQPPRLFGQSLIISRSVYQAIGGHAAVSHHVLENFHLSQLLEGAQVKSVCLGGRGTLSMRMFPEGFQQLWQGWMKAFATGAQSTDSRILSVSIVWLTALSSVVLLLPILARGLWLTILTFYLIAAAQIYYFARQIGTFRILTCILFPFPLFFFFILFAQSALRRAARRSTPWRGRSV